MTEQDLLDNHAVLVFNLALRLTGNRAEAEDLAQDALLRAVRALPRFRGESAVSTWVYSITVNAWKSRVRREARRRFWRAVTFGLAGAELQDVRADDPPLDAALETTERSSAVQKALMSLEDDDRAIVILRELEEKSYQEIGAALGLREGTVKSRLFRARAKLRSILATTAANP